MASIFIEGATHEKFLPPRTRAIDLRREVKPHGHGADEDLRHLQATIPPHEQPSKILPEVRQDAQGTFFSHRQTPLGRTRAREEAFFGHLALTKISWKTVKLVRKSKTNSPKLICKSIKTTDKTKERRNRYDPYEHL